MSIRQFNNNFTIFTKGIKRLRKTKSSIILKIKIFFISILLINIRWFNLLCRRNEDLNVITQTTNHFKTYFNLVPPHLRHNPSVQSGHSIALSPEPTSPTPWQICPRRYFKLRKKSYGTSLVILDMPNMLFSYLIDSWWNHSQRQDTDRAKRAKRWITWSVLFPWPG